MDELFQRLSQSKFRSQFKLNVKDALYFQKRAPEMIATHAREFLTERLAPAKPVNDGAQTPMKGHPVFVAQHATGTCCRSCLTKWHELPEGRALTQTEVEGLVQILMEWLKRQPRVEEVANEKSQAQLSLF